MKGYENTLDVYLVDIYEVEGEEDKVFVKLESKDLVGQNVEYRYFEGTWQVNKEGEQYLLNQSEIEEVVNPEWEWFWGRSRQIQLSCFKGQILLEYSLEKPIEGT